MNIDPRSTLDTIKVYEVGTGGAGVNNYVAPALTPSGSPIDSSISDLKVTQWHSESKSVSEFTEGSGFSIDSGTGNVILDVDAVNNDIVMVYRETDEAVAKVVYSSQFQLDINKLNLANTQWYMLVQELFSNIKYRLGMVIDSLRGLVWDAKDRIIANVEDPEEDKDVVNKRSCLQMIAEALASMTSLSGISRLIRGEVTSGSSSLTIGVTGVTKFMLFIGGFTYLWQGETPLQEGLDSVIDNGVTTTINFSSPIYGDGIEYILMLFIGEDSGGEIPEPPAIPKYELESYTNEHFVVDMVEVLDGEVLAIREEEVYYSKDKIDLNIQLQGAVVKTNPNSTVYARLSKYTANLSSYVALARIYTELFPLGGAIPEHPIDFTYMPSSADTNKTFDMASRYGTYNPALGIYDNELVLWDIVFGSYYDIINVLNEVA